MFDAKAKSSRWKCLADVKGVLNLAAWTPPPPARPATRATTLSSLSSSSSSSSASMVAGRNAKSGDAFGTARRNESSAAQQEHVGQWHCCIGNHELYCFSRQELQQQLLSSAPSPRQLYYDFSPSPGYVHPPPPYLSLSLSLSFLILLCHQPVV